MSVEKKLKLFPASILDYTYANGTPVYYPKVTEYSIDKGVSSGKKVYTFYPPNYFHPSHIELSRVPETLISYIKTNLFLGAQESVSEFEFIPPGEWKPKKKKMFYYTGQEKNEKIHVAYSTFRVLHEVKAGLWSLQKKDLYDDSYAIPLPIEFEGEYTYGNYYIPVGTLLLQTETEEHFEDEESTVTTTDYTYRRLQPVEIRTSKSNGERYTKYFTYSFDLDGVYDQMEAKNMLSQVIQERVVNTTRGTEVMHKKTNYGVKTDNGGILPHTVEVSYNGGTPVIETTFDKYDQYGNIVQLTGKDQTPVSYLWGYQGLYPVAQLKGVSYTQIPVRFISNVNIINPGTDAQLRSLLYELKDSFSGREQVSGYTYKRLIGLTSHFDEKGIVNFYEYDPYWRLTSVKDYNGKSMENYAYNMLNTSSGSFTPFWVNTPIMSTINNDVIAYERSYNVIMPGGEVSDPTSTEISNMTAENILKAGHGIHLYPEETDTIPTVSIRLVGFYNPEYHPSFPLNVDIDFIKDGHVAYTTTIPINSLLSTAPPAIYMTLYLPACNYQVSIRPDPFNQYEVTGLAVNIFSELQGSLLEMIQNFSTITLEVGKRYELMFCALI